jgi:hypothetical protein
MQFNDLSVDDIIETRISGERAVWPSDVESIERLRTLGQQDVPERQTFLKSVCGVLLFALAAIVIVWALR